MVDFPCLLPHFLINLNAASIVSAPLFENRAAIVADAQALVSACDCAHGCPSCIGPILASDEVRGYSPKQVALRVLSLLTDHKP